MRGTPSTRLHVNVARLVRRLLNRSFRGIGFYVTGSPRDRLAPERMLSLPYYRGLTRPVLLGSLQGGDVTLGGDLGRSQPNVATTLSATLNSKAHTTNYYCKDY